MKNLHLMPMQSTFDDGMVTVLNQHFPLDENVFVLPAERKALVGVENCIIDPGAFTPEYINAHCKEYRHIILQSLFLSPTELLRLSDEAVSKITWIVWGHDLYTVKKKQSLTVKKCFHETIHFFKKVLRGTYLRSWMYNRAVKKKVSQFHSIGIGYPYDEKMIRKKYGKKVPVVYGPVIGQGSFAQIKNLRNKNLQKNLSGQQQGPVNILIGHSGFDFIEHEKYLKKLASYRTENIHIYMVLCYGASPERISYLTNLAVQLFGKERVTVKTEMVPAEEYYGFLSTMDIAIFPFRHQSALGNTRRMAYMGTKLFFDPRGVLAKGFQLGGVSSYDCRKIGNMPYEDFARRSPLPPTDSPLFSCYVKGSGIAAWKNLLS